MDVNAPLALALSGIPALGVAFWSGRGGDPLARGIGLRWALIALCFFIGAVGLYVAGNSRPFIYTVVIVLAVAVNALLVSMLLHLRGGDTGKPGR